MRFNYTIKILLVILVFFYSCKSVFIPEGKFKGIAKGYACALIIKSDSSFNYGMEYFDVTTSCTGKWKFISTDTIVLKCGDEDNIVEKLTSGYIGGKEMKVTKIVKTKLKSTIQF